MTTYRLNEKFNGVEITFSSKPEAATLDTLKQNGFRWNKKGGYWYAVQTPERLALAEQIAESKTADKVTKKNDTKKAEPKANKYGVKVGDIFEASWGYEQTNNDFFQVVALVGDCSVRVRLVNPPMISEEAYSHGMAADRVFKVAGLPILPAVNSVFIHDDEKGDLKRLKSYAADGVSNPQFKLSSFTDAYLCTGETHKCYESWYA